MKINNKQILIILVSVAVLISAVGYITLADSTYKVWGGRVFEDLSVPVFSAVSTNNIKSTFSTKVILSSDDCRIVSTVLSYGFPSGVDEKADVTNDGKVDWIDIYLAVKSFGMGSASSGWNTPFNEDRCFFVVGNSRFLNPIDDNTTGYKINQTSIDLVASQFGKSDPYVTSYDCLNQNLCKADVNRDGRVDGRDIALVAKRLYDPYPDFCFSLSDFKPSDLDIGGDGKVDGRDIALIARNYGQKADQLKSSEATIEDIGNATYKVTATGYNIYHVDISYECNVPYTGGGGGTARAT